jgi:outer membrane protein assembly factor BamC
VKQFARLGVLAACAAFALSACSVFEGEKVDYKSTGKGVSLEVPPDLTQLSRDSRYQLSGGTVTASGYQVGQAAPTLPTAANTFGDVRIERDGSQRWLVVNRSPDQLWQPIRDFWLENGFLLAQDDQNLGIMETDWAENRAKIPQDFIRNMLGKLVDTIYSTPERDKFRTRLERAPNGGTEIYVSHRGMQEVYTTVGKDQTVWQPRPADPELEAEFLRRLMVKLGVPKE